MGKFRAFFAIFLEKKNTETVGFEPTCRLPDKMISSHSRYGLFGTSPEQAYYSTGILSLQGLTKTPFNPMLRRLEP